MGLLFRHMSALPCGLLHIAWLACLHTNSIGLDCPSDWCSHCGGSVICSMTVSQQPSQQLLHQRCMQKLMRQNWELPTHGPETPCEALTFRCGRNMWLSLFCLGWRAIYLGGHTELCCNHKGNGLTDTGSRACHCTGCCSLLPGPQHCQECSVGAHV